MASCVVPVEKTCTLMDSPTDSDSELSSSPTTSSSEYSDYFTDDDDFYVVDSDEFDEEEPMKSLEEIRDEFDRLLSKISHDLDEFEAEVEELKACF